MTDRVVAAGVLIVNNDHILAISRGMQRNNLGIPGGRVDATDRNARHTAARELYEETGVVVDPGRLRWVTNNETTTGGLYTLYEATEIVSWPRVLQSTPFEGFVGWHRPEALLGPEVTHRRFHRRIFTQCLGPLLKPRFPLRTLKIAG